MYAFCMYQKRMTLNPYRPRMTRPTHFALRKLKLLTISSLTVVWYDRSGLLCLPATLSKASCTRFLMLLACGGCGFMQPGTQER